MSVTYGFYNSIKGDRKYNALEMSSIFDGIIVDGVYMSIGDEKLAESVAAQSFEGQVEMTKMFEYGKDFFIGDIVQIANEYGMESRARISEIVTAIDTQGTVTYPTLSTVT